MDTAGNNIIKLSFYSPSQGYIAFTDGIGYTTDSGRTFTKKYITDNNVDYNGYNVNLLFKFDIAGLKAFNQNTLFVYGDYGFVPTVLYSSNGGLTFKIVFHSMYNLYQLTEMRDIFFPQNGSIGYGIDADRIFKTTNQGFNWSTIRTDPNSFFDKIQAPDDNTVFVFSARYQGKLLKTTNGGATWQAVTLPVIDDVGKIVDVYFVNASTGWLNMFTPNGKGYLFKTIDAGNSWTLLNDITANNFVGGILKFTDLNTGYATGVGYTTLKTQDAGITWEPLPRDNNVVIDFIGGDMQFISPTQFWGGGGSGFIEITTNAGGTPLPKAYFKIDTTGGYSSGKVDLLNFSNKNYQYKWYVNNNLVSTAYNASYTHDLNSTVDSVQLIVVSGTKADTLKKYQYFVLPSRPQIVSFSPATGSTGTYVTIKGKRFTNVLAVSFGGVDAASFKIISDSVITATIANGASGTISLSDVYGTISLPGFTYFTPPSTAAPVVTSLNPKAGPAGTSVTISGSNFNNTALNNLVFFGSTKAQVISASANSITCKVPVGANFEPVTVLNMATGLQGRSSKAFSVIFADSSNFTLSSFPLAYYDGYHNIGGMVYSVGGVDVDGDGRPDILSSHSLKSDAFSIFRNISDSNKFLFEPRLNLPYTGVRPMIQFCAGDLDGDGKPDIAGAVNWTEIIILKNNSVPGSINLNTQVRLGTAAESQSVAIADLDNDGKNDLVVAAMSSLEIIRNTSSPGYLSFGETVHAFTGSAAFTDIAVGDLNADGKKDIISYSTYSSTADAKATVFLNTSTPGTISFTQLTDIIPSSLNSTIKSIQLADIDGDNKLDVVLTSGNTYQVFKNTSTVAAISLASPVLFSTDRAYQDIMIENFNGDSKPDVLSSYPYWLDGFSFSENKYANGAISFSKSVVNSMGIPMSIGAADFNLDGKIDLISALTNNFYGDADIRIFSNNVGKTLDQTACIGASFQAKADLNGVAYQWQINKGSGFTNLADGTNLVGSNTQNLDAWDVPYTWNGCKFRCRVDSQYSSTINLKLRPTPKPTNVTITASDTVKTSCTWARFKVKFVIDSSTYFGGYTWLINGQSNAYSGRDSVLIYYGNRNRDTIACVITTYDSCQNVHVDTSNKIIMTVYALPGSLSIGTPDTSYCAASPSKIEAKTLYPNQPFEWYVNNTLQPGDTTGTFSTARLSGLNRIYCWQRVDGCLVQSNHIFMNETTVCPCIVNKWTGSVSNAWEDAANWSCGVVPSASSKVIIENGTLILNSNTTVYSLTAGPAANLLVNAGFNLTVLH